MEAIDPDGSRDSERVTQQRTEGGDVVKEVAQLIHVSCFYEVAQLIHVFVLKSLFWLFRLCKDLHIPGP